MIVIVVVGGWAGLTKAGYIDNFLDIKVLRSKADQAQIDAERKRREERDKERAEAEACMEECENSGKDFDFCAKKCNYSLPADDRKPVIYLYPTQQQNTLVQLDYDGEFIATYPAYDENIGGWEVTANPDGTLIHKNKEYSYLFWEGTNNKQVDWGLEKGFVVSGNDTVEFLQNKLAEIGLTPKEYNEFIVYWYPLMEDNKYNLIHFADKEYTDSAKLSVTPKPDSMLRVFMVYKSLEEKIAVEPQEFEIFERNGFTVVEWGGAEIK